MKKGFTLFIVSILLIGILAGCSGGSKDVEAEATADGKTVINFWTFWGSETRRPFIEKIISDFNESQDEIIVKHTFVPWGDIWTKNLASVAAGNPADVIINDINSVGQRAENKQVEELTTYLDESFQDQFYPHLWETVQHNNKTYAVPFNTDTRLLFYNKKAFEEVGLDPNQPPTTWAELEDAAKKLDVKSGKGYERIGFYPLWGNIGASSWMTSADNGKGFIDNDELQINTAKKVEALEWVMKWKERLGEETVQAFQAEFGSEQANPFIAEKVAMWIDVGTFYTQLKQFGGDLEYGVAPIPAYKEGKPHYADGGGFVAEVPKGSKHPKEAVEFIKYLTGPEAQKYWAMNNFDNVANMEGAEAAAAELQGPDKDMYQATIDNLKDTKMYPVPVHYPDYINRINPNIDNALLGKMSAKEALQKAEKQVEKIKK